MSRRDFLASGEHPPSLPPTFPPRPTPNRPPRRRGLLGAVAALAVAPAAVHAEPGSSDPLLGGGAADAEMIALLEEARAVLLAPEPPGSKPPTLADLTGPKPWDAPLAAAARIPARTPDGLRAKARVLHRYYRDEDTCAEAIRTFNFAEYVLVLLNGGAA